MLRPTGDFAVEQADLRRSLLGCIDWVEDWLRSEHGLVTLTSGATNACDVAFRSCNIPALRSILMSNYAHPTVEGCATQASLFLRAMTGTAVAVRQLSLEPLFLLEPREFAAGLADQAICLAEGKPALLVIEHVTSQKGLLLPVEEIAEVIKAKSPTIRLVIDGAQAVGIWRPTTSMGVDYFGSFHKYADCPAGTGFLFLNNVDAALLPYDALARSKRFLQSTDELCPTMAATSWHECWRRLGAQKPAVDLTKDVLNLRDDLVQLVGPEWVTPHLPPNSPYRSHIVAFDCGSQPVASSVWKGLLEAGFQTKIDRELIRVTLHHSLDQGQLTEFGELLRELLNRRSD